MSATDLPWLIRAALRLLPRTYREHRTAELHATLGDVADSRGLSVGAEALSLVALSIRVRSTSLLAPPSAARSRAAAIGAVVLPMLLIVPATRATSLGLPPLPLAPEFDWRWSALVPGWLAAVLAGLLTLGGAARWAHRFSILATALFICGLLALVATTNLDAAVRESGWLPLIATSAALSRSPARIRAGRRILGTTGLAVVALIAAGAAVAYVAVGPLWWISLPAPLGSALYNSRLVVGGVLLLICLLALAFRTARAAVPVVATLGMFYVGASLEANLWPNSGAREALLDGLPVGHLIIQLVLIPLVVFIAARALAAWVDRAGRPSGPVPLAG